MSAQFEIAYAPVKKWEGGWCNIAGDAGGETYAGISRNFFPEWTGWPIVDEAKNHSSFRFGATAFSSHLDSLTELRDQVADWYRAEWWDRMGLFRFPQVVADELFEQAVNLGRAGSGKYVQRLLNAYNCRKDSGTYRRLFDDLSIDGVLGPKSLDAMAIVLEQVSPDKFVHALNALQGYHYVKLAAESFPHRKFLAGWMTRTYSPK